MLTKIKSKELLTGEQMRDKYQHKYILYHSKEIAEGQYTKFHRDTSLVSALYTADEDSEFTQLPKEVRHAVGNGVWAGDYAESEPQIGAIVYG